MIIAKIIVDIASSLVDKVFDYILPDENFSVGQRVLVPFGKISKEGYIVEITDKTELEIEKLKTVISAIEPFPVISKDQLELAGFMKKKFHTGLCDALRLFLPSEMRSSKVKELIKIECYIEDEEKAKLYLSTIRKNAIALIGIITYLLENGSASQTEIGKKYNLASLKKLVQEGIVQTREVIIRRKPYKKNDFDSKDE